jgi:hypothetical protein
MQFELGLGPNESTPADAWGRDASLRALDDLFISAIQFRSSQGYRDLMRFTARFHFYSPFNAFLVHVQMPGATYVAPAHRWANSFGRIIKAGARPIVLLQPMGPVMFVFDVADIEAGPEALPLPREVTDPFSPFAGNIEGQLDQTIANAVRDGIVVRDASLGSQAAGSIRQAAGGTNLYFQTRWKPEPAFVDVPRRYDLILNSHHSATARYATLVHELGHLYAGHLGSPDSRFWPDRRGLSQQVEEFEAESISFLVCARLGIITNSAAYLEGYLGQHAEVPAISLECVLRVAGLIEQMGRQRLGERQPRGGRSRRFLKERGLVSLVTEQEQ